MQFQCKDAQMQKHTHKHTHPCIYFEIDSVVIYCFTLAKVIIFSYFNFSMSLIDIFILTLVCLT